MTFSASGQPHRLRLVGDALSAGMVPTIAAEHAIATENRRAASNPELAPTDPRWALAVRAYSQLQGSTLTPERRRRVLATARQMGVRPFDANVIIAIVQDHARCGRSLHDAAPTLKLLNAPVEKTEQQSMVGRWLMALLLATAANGVLIWWLLSGTMS